MVFGLNPYDLEVAARLDKFQIEIKLVSKGKLIFDSKRQF
jgi:hypothetical protein